jgi:hypothetical protein
VQPVAGAVAADKVIVAQPIQIAAVDIGRMHDDIHVLRDGPRLVIAYQRPFDKIVALAVAIKPRFGRAPVLAHEIVEGVPDVFTGCAGL